MLARNSEKMKQKTFKIASENKIDLNLQKIKNKQQLYPKYYKNC